MTERLGAEAAEPMYVARQMRGAHGLSLVQDAANAAMRRLADKIDADIRRLNALSGEAAQEDQ